MTSTFFVLCAVYRMNEKGKNKQTRVKQEQMTKLD